MNLAWLVIAAVVTVGARSAIAAEAPGCTHFAWDVSHELAVMKQTPHTLAAATQPGSQTPWLQLDTLYELRLAGQSGVTYAVKPAKLTPPDGARGGLVRFRVDKAGLYRISISSRHWIDVADRGQLINSHDFPGARDCERPHKIVEFELPAGTELVLQFSGSTESAVVVGITAVNDLNSH
jgi:hypothetical protein